jgi:hypothetical protein
LRLSLRTTASAATSFSATRMRTRFLSAHSGGICPVRFLV